MTKNEIEIRQKSNGFSSGKLYVGGVFKEIECISIFDEKSYNFHLCPKVKQDDIADEIGKKRKAVINSLKQLDFWNGETIVSNQKVLEYKKDVIYISEGEGSIGGHRTCREFGNLFKYISAQKNGVKYELNFMRFFVDDTSNGFKNVNCILKAIQFDRCMENYVNYNSSAKGGCDICYPLCFSSQTDDELERILNMRLGQSFCFNPKIDFNDDAKTIAKEFVRLINISDTYGKKYIIKKEVLNKSIDNKYFLKLNRTSHFLEIYEKDGCSLLSGYPIRRDFDSSSYVMYTLKKEIPCIFGGSGQMQTPSGIFNIEEVSRSEYISTYHPKYKEVKFFGYLIIFEDYFIHSDMYLADTTSDNFRQKESISKQDKYTSGCIRITQEDLEWLVENISVGTAIEL